MNKKQAVLEEGLTKEELQEKIGFTKKELYKNTINIAWPSVLESFLVSLVGFLDTIMVSSLGLTAIAAIGLATQPKFVGLAIFIGMSTATSSVVARRRGEGNQESANKIVRNIILVCIFMTIIVSIIFVFGADFIIRLAGSAEDTHDDAVLYFRIIMGGILFTTVSLVINAAQRGAGNTRIAMVTNITSNIINVTFNYLLIGGNLGFPALGIAGAAIATVLGSMVACCMSILSLTKPHNFLYIKSVKGFFASKHDVKSLLDVGSSAFVEQIFVRVGFMLLMITVANLGTTALAAHQIGTNFTSIAFSVSDGLSVASVALVGRSLGQKNKYLAKAYSVSCQRLGLAFSVLLSIIYFTFKTQLFSLFSTEEQVLEYAVIIMTIVSFALYLQMQQVIVLGCLRGAGDTKYTAFISLISVAIVRPGLSYLLCYPCGLGIMGIWLGFTADQAIRCLMGHVRFKSGTWLNKDV